MDFESPQGEKGEKRMSQSMLTPPNDETFKRQHIIKLKNDEMVSLNLNFFGFDGGHSRLCFLSLLMPGATDPTTGKRAKE